jgi:hypothetical protein
MMIVGSSLHDKWIVTVSKTLRSSRTKKHNMANARILYLFIWFLQLVNNLIYYVLFNKMNDYLKILYVMMPSVCICWSIATWRWCKDRRMFGNPQVLAMYSEHTPWSEVLFDNLTVARFVKTFSLIYRTGNFVSLQCSQEPATCNASQRPQHAGFLRRGVVGRPTNRQSGGPPIISCPRLLIHFIQGTHLTWISIHPEMLNTGHQFTSYVCIPMCDRSIYYIM